MNLTQTEFIEKAAIKINDSIISIPKPGRHNDIIIKLTQQGYSIYHITDSTFGFITSTGRFVDRIEAKYIAQSSNQIPINSNISTLCSEHLW